MKSPAKSNLPWHVLGLAGMFSPLGMAAALVWGGALGFFHASTAEWLMLGPLLAAISVWNDRKLIAEGRPKRISHPVAAFLGSVVAFLAIFTIATFSATILVAAAYWTVRALHPISN